MDAWLEQNRRADGWAMTPAGGAGAIYFADATLASAFVARWCAGSRVDTTGGVFQVREDQPTPRVGARQRKLNASPMGYSSLHKGVASPDMGSPTAHPSRDADFRWERSHPNANSPSGRANPRDANHVHNRLAPAPSAAGQHVRVISTRLPAAAPIMISSSATETATRACNEAVINASPIHNAEVNQMLSIQTSC